MQYINEVNECILFKQIKHISVQHKYLNEIALKDNKIIDGTN